MNLEPKIFGRRIRTPKEGINTVPTSGQVHAGKVRNFSVIDGRSGVDYLNKKGNEPKVFTTKEGMIHPRIHLLHTEPKGGVVSEFKRRFKK